MHVLDIPPQFHPSTEKNKNKTNKIKYLDWEKDQTGYCGEHV